MSFSKKIYYTLCEYLCPNIKGVIIATMLYSIGFIIYLELSPRLGNIWYRTGSDGLKHINFSGLIEFVYKPFTHGFFWRPQFWDINIYIGLFITVIFINLLRKVF